MIFACRLLLLIVAAELLFGAYAFTTRNRQIGPQIPERSQTDPFSWNELNDLSKQVQLINSSSEWQKLAEALIGKGFYIQGELAFREAVKRDSANLTAAQGVAFCLDRTGRIAESNKLYQQLVSKTSGETRQLILYAIARNHLRIEEPQTAEQLFYENYDFIPAKLMFNKLLVKSDRGEQALPLINQFLRKLPQSLLFQQVKREALIENADQAQALHAADMIERAELLIPVNFNTDFLTERNQNFGFNRHWYEYQTISEKLPPAQKLTVLQELQDSQKDYLSPYTLVLLKESARAAADAKNAEVLKHHLNQIENYEIVDAEIWELRGDLFDLTGDSDQAIQCWNKSVSMTPNNIVYQKLASLYAETEQNTKREQALADAALDTGLTAFRNNDLVTAGEMLKISSKLNSNSARCWFYQAELDRLKKQFSAAKLKYEKCLQINPYHGRARLQLQHLPQIPPAQ
ncbi:tetratricopeptide repeat protein [Rubinisphaera italica]|uniref:Tetratricopeptide repeat protein n=1 Tax=Rubinisphaera italica TaxID=2527969 RepID=A0A5C5XEP7_9PLAN|nr:hypothetical protein [Rubinisphaera italica]TWT60595.1 Tetratricopeptide repeat protein [Rubinisphaera italica]